MSVLSAEQEKVVQHLYDAVNGQAEKFSKIESAIEKLSAPVYHNGNEPKTVFGANGEKVEGDYSFGNFLQTVDNIKRGNRVEQSLKRLQDVYGSVRINDQGIVTQALTEDSGSSGGYLVPTEFRNELLTEAAEMAIVRPRARVFPMSARSMQIPAMAVTNAPANAGETPFYGGVVANWTEINTTKTETTPAFEQIEFINHELAGFTTVHNALLADSAVPIAPLLTSLFSGALSWFEDYAFLRGNGTGQPLGVLNSPALESGTRATASTVALADTAGMLAKLLPSSMGSATWVAHITVLPQIVQLADSSNIIWIPNAVEALPMRLHGMPIVFTEKLPALGTAGDLILCDFSKYIITDRNDLSIDSSIHANFTSNQTVWRFSKRCDGKPWLSSTITLQDTNTTVSPFVQLAA